MITNLVFGWGLERMDSPHPPFFILKENAICSAMMCTWLLKLPVKYWKEMLLNIAAIAGRLLFLNNFMDRLKKPVYA